MKKNQRAKKGFTPEELEEVFYCPNEEGMKYAFLPVFSMVLADYPSLYKKIDDLYEKNPFQYHIALKKSVFRHFFRFDSLNLEKEFYAKRLLSLFEYDIQSGNGVNTMALGQAAQAIWHKQTRYLKTTDNLNYQNLAYELYAIEIKHNPSSLATSPMAFIGDVRSMLSKKHSKRSFLLDQRIRFEYVMLFLAKTMQKPIDYRNIESIMRMRLLYLKGTDEMFITKQYIDFNIEHTKVEMGEAFFKQVKEITHEMTPYFTKVAHFDKLFGYNDVEIFEDKELTMYQIFELIRFIELIENYSLPEVYLLSNKKEAEKEVEQILSICPYQGDSDDDKLGRYYYVYFGLFLKRIIQDIKKNKTFFFEMEDNEQVFEIQKLQEEITEIKNKASNLRKENETLTKKLNGIEKEHNKELSAERRKVKELEEQLESLTKKQEEQNEELYSLREFAYAMQRESEETLMQESTEYLPAFLKQIETKDIVIIGGHPKWKQQVKEHIPNVVFIDKDTRYDSTLITNADYVFYQIDFLSHGVFYRTHPVIKQNHIPFGFLPTGNITLTLQRMHKEIERLGYGA